MSRPYAEIGWLAHRFPGIAKSPVSALAALIAFWAASPAAAIPDEAMTPDRLKRMSLEELMNIEVTSVSRQPEKLSRAASAIQVITGEY